MFARLSRQLIFQASFTANNCGPWRLCSTLHTSERYPSMKLARKSKYGKPSKGDLDVFRSIFNGDNGRIVTDPDQLVDYNVDWMKTCYGESNIALLPKTTAELSQILKYCNEKNLAIAPRGGNTGLVGGSVPVFDEIAVSLRLMNNIETFDSTSGIVSCEAGVILDTLDEFLLGHGFTVPLDLSARHSCQIGGNIATNAGGIRLLRYGSLKANVLGLEYVLANGDVIDCMSTLRKDNTGYDLRSLLIGSEGTLGIITKVALLCPPKPSSVNVALLGVKSFEDILRLFRHCRVHLTEILSAFEFFDDSSYDVVKNNLRYEHPMQTDFKYYVLIETSGSNSDHDFEKLEKFTEHILESGIISENDVVLATDIAQQRSLWRLREEIAVGLQMDGYVYKFDISLPQKEFPNMHNAIKERLKGFDDVRVASYGHVGDGNLHLNITSPEFNSEIMSAVDPFLFEFVRDCNGSISAEHGLGLRKRSHIGYSKRKLAIENMIAIKRLLDPKGILNPYKTIDPDLPLDH